MRAAMIGLGKLGLPVSLAWAQKHEMCGYDVSPHAKEIMRTRKYPHLEPGAQKLLDAGVNVDVYDSIDECVGRSDIVFVSVQTPHGAEYEGITRMPETRADFDYAFLQRAVEEVASAAKRREKHVALVVISTVLPGTCERDILPLINGNKFVSLIYAPMFIAQSTVVEDTKNPEFILLGIDRSDARGIEMVKEFFTTFHSAEKLCFMGVSSAELTKVAYNVALSVKITIANSLMEICHKTGANVDDVTSAVGRATDRVISTKYLRGGMPDAGPCHPRDLIAMAWLAKHLDLSYDFFGSMVHSREAQASFIAKLATKAALDKKLPIMLLGKAYKKGTNLVIGSSAILLKNILAETAELEIDAWDPYVDGPRSLDKPAVFVVATDHDEFFRDVIFPFHSMVIDPWGKMADRAGVEVIRVGRH